MAKTTVWLAMIALAMAMTAHAAPGDMATIAGNGEAGYAGDGGQATAAQLHFPRGSFVDAFGNIYIADTYNHRVRKIYTSGTITTIAGNGTADFSGDGGPATAASLSYPNGIFVQADGTVYIADSFNDRIRKVDTGGIISTVAGIDEPGYTGDGGQATLASLNYPTGVIVDSTGNVYIADMYNHCIRKIDASGTITTIAGSGVYGNGGDGGPATAASLAFPRSIVFDGEGNLLIADEGNGRIRKIGTTGSISTIAGGACCSLGDGGPATLAMLIRPAGIALDQSGNFYVADFGDQRVRKIDTLGTVTTVAGNGSVGFSGDGGPAALAVLAEPTAVFVDPVGAILVSDSSNNRLRIVEGTDADPAAFLFADQANVALSTVVTSNTISVIGINVPAPISVSGGEYEINTGGLWTSATGTVNNGDAVRVRHLSSANYNSATNTTLTVGGVSDTFTSTTVGADTTPNAFSFIDQTNVSLSTLVTSNSISVSGISAPAPISVTGGEYSVNSGIWTSATGTVSNASTVRVRQTSSSNYNTTTNTILTIGGVSDTFSVTTTAGTDTTPNPFFFIDQTNVSLSTLVTSNSISVSGINAPAPIFVSGGEYEINTSGLWTSATGSVSNGSLVRVRQTSSSNYNTTTNTILTIGGISDTFSVTTTAGTDTTPNPFFFIDQTNVSLSTLVTSNSISVSGINAPSPISVTGGEYEINGNSVWTSVTGSVSNGSLVRVRQTSSSNNNTTTNTVLTIGGISDTFNVTTIMSSPVSSVTLSASPSSPQAENTPVTFMAVATGGTGTTEYQFSVQAPGGVMTVLQQYGPSNTFPYTPAIAGTYNIRVFARNAGSTATYEAARWLTYTVVANSPITAVTITASPGSPQVVNTPVTFTAAATGGVNKEYQFAVQAPGGTMTVIQNYGPSNTFPYTPATAGTYNVRVFARNAGNPATYEAARWLTYVANPAITAVGLSASPTGSQMVNMPVTFTATPTGGGANKEYQFAVQTPGGTMTVVRPYATSNTFTYTPTITGTHNIRVFARNVGNAATYEAARWLLYDVVAGSPITAVGLSAGPSSPQAVNTPVLFTATPTGGGATIEYQFAVQAPGGTMTVIQQYGPSDTFPYTPATAGTYNFRVFVRNVGNPATYEAARWYAYTVTP